MQKEAVWKLCFQTASIIIVLLDNFIDNLSATDRLILEGTGWNEGDLSQNIGSK